jgi:protein phosphatase methylesterase 1
MSDNFRKSVLNRLPAMPPPMAPTKAPWAEIDEDELEELEGEDTMGSLGAYVLALLLVIAS